MILVAMIRMLSSHSEAIVVTGDDTIGYAARTLSEFTKSAKFAGGPIPSVDIRPWDDDGFIVTAGHSVPNGKYLATTVVTCYTDAEFNITRPLTVLKSSRPSPTQKFTVDVTDDTTRDETTHLLRHIYDVMQRTSIGTVDYADWRK